MAEPQVSQRLAAFAAAVSKAMLGARELVETHEEQQRLAQSRARRRDLDRPRMSVHKDKISLLSRIPNADRRNLLSTGGRLSHGVWHVWALEPWAEPGSSTDVFVGNFDTWDEAMSAAYRFAEQAKVLSTGDDDAANYVSWGEVPC